MPVQPHFFLLPLKRFPQSTQACIYYQPDIVRRFRQRPKHNCPHYMIFLKLLWKPTRHAKYIEDTWKCVVIAMLKMSFLSLFLTTGQWMLNHTNYRAQAQQEGHWEYIMYILQNHNMQPSTSLAVITFANNIITFTIIKSIIFMYHEHQTSKRILISLTLKGKAAIFVAKVQICFPFCYIVDKSL